MEKKQASHKNYATSMISTRRSEEITEESAIESTIVSGRYSMQKYDYPMNSKLLEAGGGF